MLPIRKTQSNNSNRIASGAGKTLLAGGFPAFSHIAVASPVAFTSRLIEASLCYASVHCFSAVSGRALHFTAISKLIELIIHNHGIACGRVMQWRQLVTSSLFAGRATLPTRWARELLFEY